VPGVTASRITVGNVATISGFVPGLFKGAEVGVQAYFAYVNSLGGVEGRKLVVDTGDDVLQCSLNKAKTLALLPDVFAFVGSFSLFDNCGGAVIPPTVPNISDPLNASVEAMPNTFSTQPMVPGWADGGLLWIEQHYPEAVKHVGALVGTIGSAEESWKYDEHAMQVLGYHISTVIDYAPLTTQFTSDVINMEQAGVQMVVFDQADISSIAAFLKTMQLQGFNPPLVVSDGVVYDGSFIGRVGAQIASKVISDQHQALYLGSDASRIPEVAAFLHWVNQVSPGFTPDIYSVYAWTSAMLFVQALRAAGPHPTQVSLLAQLRKIHTFDGGGMLAPADPASKIPSTCFILARVVNGQWQRFDSPSSGYICTGTFIRYPGGT